MRTAVNGGSELLIFAPRAARSRKQVDVSVLLIFGYQRPRPDVTTVINFNGKLLQRFY